MNTVNPQNVIITPADFADTGQWRLIIHISRTGMAAFLKHLSDTTKPIVEMFRNNWDESENSDLLSKIENCVYDHPGLLDDYSTDIIIDTPIVAFAPSEIIDNEENIEENIFSALYPGSDRELMTDRIGDVTALFSLCDGLDGFLSRTIPGARLRNNLAILIEYFSNKNLGDARVYVDIHGNNADISAFNQSGLLAASTRRWKHEDDIIYMIFQVLNAYNIAPENANIYLSGMPEVRTAITPKLRQFCGYVVKTTMPEIAEKYNLPSAVALLINKSSTPLA